VFEFDVVRAPSDPDGGKPSRSKLVREAVVLKDCWLCSDFWVGVAELIVLGVPTI
jgi:hypothetical protein